MFCKTLKKCIRPVLAAFGVSLVLGPTAAALAQEDDGYIEEIVTIGTPGGAGIQKRDVSFAISVLNEDEIAKCAPKSTADLLKAIPGVWSKAPAAFPVPISTSAACLAAAMHRSSR
jgi:hypothetical protein